MIWLFIWTMFRFKLQFFMSASWNVPIHNCIHLGQGITYRLHFQGSMMFVINVDTENGGMQMNNDFCVDFGDEPEGPSLAHEVTFW